MSKPQIYVACLAAYNNGKMHGKWIPCTSLDEIEQGIKDVLKTSPEPNSEEWAIHDHEYLGAFITENTSAEEIMEIVEFFDEVGDDDLGEAILNECSGDVKDARKLWENYHGECDSVEDWAYQLAEDCGYLQQVPQHLAYHIDWKSYARDLLLDGYTEIRCNGKSHIFSTY